MEYEFQFFFSAICSLLVDNDTPVSQVPPINVCLQRSKPNLTLFPSEMGVPWSAGNKDMGLPSGYYSAHTVYFMCDVWPSHMVTSGYKMYSKDNNCGFWSQPLCLFSMEVGGGGRRGGGRGGTWGEEGVKLQGCVEIGNSICGILLLLVELELGFTQGHFSSVNGYGY